MNASFDGLVCVSNYVACVSSTCIEQNRDLKQAVFAVDGCRTGDLLDVGYLTKRNLRSVGSGDKCVRQLSQVFAKLRSVADSDREALPSFNGRRQVVFADGGFNDFLHLANIDSVRGPSLPIRLEIKIT